LGGRGSSAGDLEDPASALSTFLACRLVSLPQAISKMKFAVLLCLVLAVSVGEFQQVSCGGQTPERDHSHHCQQLRALKQ
jgi:hypothetical protein